MKPVFETAECEEVRNSIFLCAQIRKAREPNEIRNQKWFNKDAIYVHHTITAIQNEITLLYN